MLNSKQLQNVYIDLYTCLREYIWPMHIVSLIADLEISVYQTFPELIEIKTNLIKLKSECLRYVKDDEELTDTFNDFIDTLNSSSTLFAKLNTRVEGENDEDYKN